MQNNLLCTYLADDIDWNLPDNAIEFEYDALDNVQVLVKICHYTVH